VSRRTQIRVLVEKHRQLAHTTFRSDPERHEAEHRWLMDAVIVLLLEELSE